jgi:hypothetical protein
MFAKKWTAIESRGLLMWSLAVSADQTKISYTRHSDAAGKNGSLAQGFARVP